MLHANNSRVYATADYLNFTCNHSWDALVMGDYESIMPLPHRKKFGIAYLFIPPFVQQLGIFSSQLITAELVTAFLRSIPSKFSYSDLVLNSGNASPKGALLRKNYLLRLDNDYALLKAAYSRSAKRNIAKAIQEGIVIVENISPEQTIRLHQQRFGSTIGPTAEDYSQLKALLIQLTQKAQCVSFAAKKGDDIIATSTYLLYQNRIIFLLNGNAPISLQNGATHLLKDYVIRQFAGSGLVMDFEGSDNESFARFYTQFGATEIEYYPQLTLNRLPRLLRWLKPPSATLSIT